LSKVVQVYLRKSEFIICSSSQTSAGFWVTNGHFSRVPEVADAVELGRAVVEALDASTGIVAYDKSRSPSAPFLSALGLKSYRSFMKGALSIDVSTDDDDVLTVMPMRNMGPREGFHYVRDEARVIEDRSAASLGRTVKETVARAR